MSEKAKRLKCPKIWKVLDKKELNDWSSHLVPTKLLFKWSHVVISEFTNTTDTSLSLNSQITMRETT